jgi:hypothetical protein
MPTKFSRQQSIAYRMMCGNKAQQGSKRIASKRAIAEFFQRHEELVTWIESRLPRIGSRRCSTGVGAVMAKCALFYGKEHIEPMIEAFRSLNFNGANDPAHVLWLWLLRNTKSVSESYRNAVTACRAYCEGRKLDHKLRPATRDIFLWDKTFTTMLPVLNATAKKSAPKKPRKKRTVKPKITEPSAELDVIAEVLDEGDNFYEECCVPLSEPGNFNDPPGPGEE